MSDTENTELEKRLAALEKGSARAPTAAQRRSPLLALIVILVIGAGGALLYLLSQPDEEEALPTATPESMSMTPLKLRRLSARAMLAASRICGLRWLNSMSMAAPLGRPISVL